MSRIFISYRRSDASADAGRLRDRLAERFGDALIFQDVNRINPGQRFAAMIDEALASCDVFLAIIGPAWLDCRTQDGTRRLDNPQDWVRVETAKALAREGVTVIPVRVRGAPFPAKAALPDDLQPLRDLEDCELTDRKWLRDAEDLVVLLEGYLGIKAQRQDGGPSVIAGAAAAAGAMIVRAMRGFMAASRWTKLLVLCGVTTVVAAAAVYVPDWLKPAPDAYSLQIDPPKVLLEWRPGDEKPAQQIVRYTNDGRAALTMASFALEIGSAAKAAYRLRENACSEKRLSVGESCTVLVEFDGKWLEDYQKDSTAFNGKLQFEIKQSPDFVYSTKVMVSRKP